MAKYLEITTAGDKQEVQPVNSSAGAGDATKMIQLDAAGRIDTSMMPVGIGADTKSLVTTDDLAAGDIVNVYDNASTETARKADATTAGKEAVGFVLAVTSQPAAATVYFDATITGLTGLTRGSVQFLSTTAGGATETAPTASNTVVQRVGVAISDTEISFEPGEPITRV